MSEAGEKPGILVIGVGNPFCGDDAAGLEAARLLGARRLPGMTVIEISGEGASIMEAWENFPAVIVIDAVTSDSPPGTLHRIDAIRQPLPAQAFRHSTHALTVADAIEIARTLKRLPGKLLFYGVEGKNFTAGSEMSEAVRDAVNRLVGMVLSETGSS